MFDFEFEHIIYDDPELNFDKGVFLWVFHIDKIPPHIGLSVNESFYSLKSTGVDVGLDVLKVLRVIKDKNIASVLIRLSKELTSIEVEKSYKYFTKTEPGFTTCLTPINKVLKVESASKLSELLIQLQKEGVLSRVYGYNLPTELTGIRKYSTEDITNRLMDLQNKSE